MQHFGVLFDAAGHLFCIVELGNLVQIDDDGLDPLAAHHCADAAACGQARRRPSLSLKAMPASSPCYSPTGPHSASATFLPYFA
jgi:hypothetical protein